MQCWKNLGNWNLQIKSYSSNYSSCFTSIAVFINQSIQCWILFDYSLFVSYKVFTLLSLWLIHDDLLKHTLFPNYCFWTTRDRCCIDCRQYFRSSTKSLENCWWQFDWICLFLTQCLISNRNSSARNLNEFSICQKKLHCMSKFMIQSRNLLKTIRRQVPCSSR